jgi:anti-sigma regulatory factor (Ser/Thr protein kinase)
MPLSEDARERLALLVSELVTNSVRHAGSGPGDDITLRISSRDGRVRIAIRDRGPGFSHPSLPPLDPFDAARGLRIVDDVADTWGADRDADGFTVWCEVATEAVASEQLTAG